MLATPCLVRDQIALARCGNSDAVANLDPVVRSCLVVDGGAQSLGDEEAGQQQEDSFSANESDVAGYTKAPSVFSRFRCILWLFPLHLEAYSWRAQSH